MRYCMAILAWTRIALISFLVFLNSWGVLRGDPLRRRHVSNP